MPVESNQGSGGAAICAGPLANVIEYARTIGRSGSWGSTQG